MTMRQRYVFDRVLSGQKVASGLIGPTLYIVYNGSNKLLRHIINVKQKVAQDV
jgi:hypothetical protein